MYLIVTIDAEEDNWGEYNLSEYSLSNIEKIPYLQKLFDEFDVKPTYLVTYPVANNERSVFILKKIMDEGKCEIGAHCHPWNTPPFEEEKIKKNTMLNNLPPDLQYRKIKMLRDKIKENFGTNPLSFRAGRWGFNKEIAKNLYNLGFKIDTSVTPFTDWSNYHYGPDFSDIYPEPFRFSYDNFPEKSLNGDMIEIPVTIGFLKNNFKIYHELLKIFRTKIFKMARIVRILKILNFFNLVWLSPEIYSAKDMINLLKLVKKKEYKLINMTFHSSSLKEGLNQFVKNKKDEEEFYSRIREFLSFTKEDGITSITISECLNPSYKIFD